MRYIRKKVRTCSLPRKTTDLRVGNTGVELSHSGHVSSPGFSQDVSDGDIFDQLGIDTRLLNRGLQDGRKQVLGKRILEATLLVLGQSRSDRGTDDNIVGLLSKDVFTLRWHGGGEEKKMDKLLSSGELP